MAKKMKMDSRRSSERVGAVSRVHEDMSQPAMLPQNVIQFSMGMGVRDKDYSYNDTVAGIDHLSNQYVDTVNRYMDSDQ